MRRCRIFLWVFCFAQLTGCASNQLRYGYQLFDKEEGNATGWRLAPDHATFQHVLEEKEVLQSCVLELGEGEDIKRIERTISAPSGDWFWALSYGYHPEGELESMISDFSTFGGFHVATGEVILVRCLQVWQTERNPPEGTLEWVMLSEEIEDLKTGESVEGVTFYRPPIEHWETTKELPSGLWATKKNAPSEDFR